MVDREVSPAYVEDAGKRSVKQAFQEQARGIIDCLGAKQEWWAAGWNPPGDKVDGLAIDATGRLLVIEVKPGTASTKEFAKAPLQVAMYVWWVTKWIEDDPAHAREVLLGMAGQRTALGLFGNKAPKLGDPIRVVPVIAIGKPVGGGKRRERFKQTLDCVKQSDKRLQSLRIWAVEESGEISSADATQLDDRVC